MNGSHLKIHHVYSIVVLSLCFFFNSISSADVIRISPGARANGMGEAMVAVVDPMSADFNPGTMGLYAFNRNFSFSTSKTNWISNIFGNSYKVDYRHYFAGLKFDYPHENFLKAISLGVEYHNKFLDLGEFDVLRENNRLFTTTHSWMNCETMILSLGYRSFVDLGVGVGFQYVREHLRSNPDDYWKEDNYGAGDWGIIARKSLSSVIQNLRKEYVPGLLPHYSFNIIPALAYSRNNIAEKHNNNTLPELSRYGYSLEFRMETEGVLLFSFLHSKEHIHDKHRFSGGREINNYGREITALDILQVRWGNSYYLNSDNNRNTVGYTFKTDGITKLLMRDFLKSYAEREDIFFRILKRLSIQYSSSLWKSNSCHLVDDTTWYEFRISF